MGDRPPKSIKPETNFTPGKKLKIKKKINLHGTQKAYQLAETTARDGLLRLWQRTVSELPFFIARSNKHQA